MKMDGASFSRLGTRIAPIANPHMNHSRYSPIRAIRVENRFVAGNSGR
jgi:hypothetical protein